MRQMHLENTMRILLYINKKLRKDSDSPILVDGYEGEGKSTFGFHLLHMNTYINKGVVTKEDAQNFTTTLEAFLIRLKEAERYQLVVYDEAGDISSTNTITRLGKFLKDIFNTIRKKNLIVVFIMPCVYEGAGWLIRRRAKHLFHVHKRGKVWYYPRLRLQDLVQKYKKFGDITYKPYSMYWWRDTYPDYKGILLDGYEDNKDEKIFEKLDLAIAEVREQKKKIEPVRLADCLQCNHQWRPRRWPPPYCSKCKSPKWNEAPSLRNKSIIKDNKRNLEKLETIEVALQK